MGFFKEKVMPWIYGAASAIISASLIIVVMSCCSSKTDTAATVTMPDIKIYIKGEIASPGLYKIGADDRLAQLIDLAGGVTENADVDRINLAAPLTDGTTVVIPKTGSKETIDPMIAFVPQTSYEVQTSFSVSAGKITSGTININTAPVSELMRLPGVGEKTAEKIVSYRQAYGNFLSAEEIMNVSGIGEKTFEKMKPFLAVE